MILLLPGRRAMPPIQVGSYGQGGGHEFSEDEIDGVIKQWKDLLADLQDDLGHAIAVRDVKPPAA
ncbi:hypothetical protein [Amycolatopsis panacis]|uniref:hypothetical protein n=1 Tax=Amycolatopsis panacis TaxID=2340917 RepID=UPI001F30690D|nr:hypothetical protein [Amycolatopsis panacis]